METILDVDLTAFEEGNESVKSAIAEEARQSLQTGFVYVRHDLSADMLDTAYEMLAAFFALSQDAKDTVIAAGSNGQAGYTPKLVETAISSDVADWKEMLNWGAQLPDNHPLKARYPSRYLEPALPEALVPGISEVLYQLHDGLLEVQRRFLRLVAVGIGCHIDFFDQMIRYGSVLNRAIHYPPMTQAPAIDEQRPVWAAAHGDINLVTALPRATGKGLQVQTADGWIDAAPPQGHAIINTGIMLERLTNGLIPTGIHRVEADPEQTEARLSMVQFAHPSPSTILSPVSACVSKENPQRFSAISADELLAEVLYDINLIE